MKNKNKEILEITCIIILTIIMFCSFLGLLYKVASLTINQSQIESYLE